MRRPEDYLNEFEYQKINSLEKYNTNTSNQGYVYICINTYLQKFTDKAFKIGSTNDPYRRFITDICSAKSDASVPGDYKPILVLKCDMYKNIEDAIHKRLGKSNIPGRTKEWYEKTLEEIMVHFLEFSKYATGNEIIIMTDDKSLEKRIKRLLTKKKTNKITTIEEYIVDKCNRVINKPVDYKRHAPFRFEDVGLKVGDKIKHKRRTLLEICENNKVKFVSNSDKAQYGSGEYSLTYVDNILCGFEKNVNKAGPKNFYTLDGRNIGKMWNVVRSGIANVYQEGEEATLWE